MKSFAFMMLMLFSIACVAQGPGDPPPVMTREQYLEAKHMKKDRCNDDCPSCCEALKRKAKACKPLCLEYKPYCEDIKLKNKRKPQKGLDGPSKRKCNPDAEKIASLSPAKAFKYQQRCPQCGICIDKSKYFEKYPVDLAISAQHRTEPGTTTEFPEVQSERTFCEWEQAKMFYDRAMRDQCPICKDAKFIKKGKPGKCKKPCTKIAIIKNCKKCNACIEPNEQEDYSECDVWVKQASLWKYEEPHQIHSNLQYQVSRNLFEKEIRCAAVVASNHAEWLAILDKLCQGTCENVWDTDALSSEDCCSLAKDCNEDGTWDGCVIDWDSGYCVWSGENLHLSDDENEARHLSDDTWEGMFHNSIDFEEVLRSV